MLLQMWKIVFSCVFFSFVQSEQLIIAVDDQHGTDDDSCGIQKPCATINMGLIRVQNISSSSGGATLTIGPGNYMLEHGEEIIQSKDNSIIGSGREETVISCRMNAGLYFIGSRNNISIKSITLYGCGYSNSIDNIWIPSIMYYPVLLQPVALSFVNCANVTIQNVTIIKSNGSGLLFDGFSCDIIESLISGGYGTSAETIGGGIVAVDHNYRYDYFYDNEPSRLSIINTLITDNNYTNSAKLVDEVPIGAVTLISISNVYINSSSITDNNRGLTIYSRSTSCESNDIISFNNVSIYSNRNTSIAFVDRSTYYEKTLEIKLSSVNNMHDIFEIKSEVSISSQNVSTKFDSFGQSYLSIDNNVFDLLMECQNSSELDFCTTNENVPIQYKNIDLMLEMSSFEVGYCYNFDIFNFSEKIVSNSRGKCPVSYSVAIENIPRCWDNHINTLCGQCKENYSVAINSPYLACAPCNDAMTVLKGWVLLIVLEFIPVTVMVAVIAVLNVNLNQGSLKAYIFFCQILTIPFPSVSYPSWFVVRYNYSRRWLDFIFFPFSIWNLGFINYPSCNLYTDLSYQLNEISCTSMSICISTDMTPLGAIAFWYVIGFYPFLLLALSYGCIIMYDRGYRCIVCVVRPIHRLLAQFWRKFNIRPSLSHTIASVYTLCFTQLAATSFKLLHFVTYNDRVRFFYDGAVPASWQHCISSILALIVLIVFIIVPVVYLSSYPFKWFQKCMNKVKIRKDLLVSITDVFTAPYSDGTQNTWDYRYYASSHFILQLLVMVLYYIPSYDHSVVILGFQIGFCCLFLISLVVFRPYRRKVHTVTDIIIILSLLGFSVGFVVATKVKGYIYLLIILIFTFIILFLYLTVVVGYCVRWFYRKYKYYRSTFTDDANKRTSRAISNKSDAKEELVEITSSDFHAEALPDRMMNPTEYQQSHDEND